jgi:hypothetical protein
VSNAYNTFQEASDSNWDLLVDIFGTSKDFKLIKPSRKNSVFDGILTCKKDGRDVVILIEVKRRQFNIQTLQKEYENTLFLEKDKYTYLHAQAKNLKSPGREIKIWYLSKTIDGVVFVHDITDVDYQWISTKMNSVTYSDNQIKKQKLVALLHTSTALLARQTNLLK